MKSLKGFLQHEFDVGELEHCSFRALEYEVAQTYDSSITVTQLNKHGATDIDCNNIDCTRTGDTAAILPDLWFYQRVLEQMLCVSKTTNPIPQIHASNMACKKIDPYERHFRKLHSILTNTTQIAPSHLIHTTPEKEAFAIEGYCDATLGSQILDPYDGRLEFVVFQKIGNTVHPTHWGPISSREWQAALKRLRYSLPLRPKAYYGTFKFC